VVRSDVPLLQVYACIIIGKYENAHERMQSAVADWRLIGDPRFTAFGLNLFSQSALILERYDEARAALEESVELNKSVGTRWNLGTAYRGLGAVAHAQGEYQQAVFMFRQSLETFTELGGRQEVARVLADMGRSVFELVTMLKRRVSGVSHFVSRPKPMGLLWR